MQIVDSHVRVVGYSIPALEGNDTTLSCPSGQVLTGHNGTGTSAMCMQNGNWEPDLREVIKIMLYNSIMFTPGSAKHDSNAIITAAICGPPAPHPNGIIAPYSNTLGGAIVIYLCWT